MPTSGPDRPRIARSQGMLGADIVPDGAGVWRIERILPGEPSDPRARSPLMAPGVAAAPGDAIVAVDGHPVDPRWGPAEHLADAAGKPVALTIETRRRRTADRRRHPARRRDAAALPGVGRRTGGVHA